MTIRKGNRKEKEHGVKAFHVDWPAATGKWHESYCKGWMVTCSSRHTQIHTHAIRPWQRPCLWRPEKNPPWLIGLKSHINPSSTFQPLNTTLHHTHARTYTQTPWRLPRHLTMVTHRSVWTPWNFSSSSFTNTHSYSSALPYTVVYKVI